MTFELQKSLKHMTEVRLWNRNNFSENAVVIDREGKQNAVSSKNASHGGIKS